MVKAFAQRTAMPDRKGHRWTPPMDVAAAKGRADSGDLELDLTELFTMSPSSPATSVSASPCASTRCRTSHLWSSRALRRLPRDQPAGRSPHRGRRRAAAPPRRAGHLQVVCRTALPLPLRRSTSPGRGRPSTPTGSTESVGYDDDALDELYRLTDGYPYFVQAYGKVTWDCAPSSPITATDVKEASPLAEAELAVGFFGARFERATPAERELHAGDGRARCRDGGRSGVDGRRSGPPRSQALLTLTGPGRADQEGAGLRRGARRRALHRPALRSVPRTQRD